MLRSSIECAILLCLSCLLCVASKQLIRGANRKLSAGSLHMRGLVEDQFEWDITPEAGYPQIAFDGANTESEVIFRYNYTGITSEYKYLEAQIYLDDCVTVADTTAISITNTVNEGNEIQLDVDIVQSTITDSPLYTATTPTTANIAFCVRVDYNYKDSGGEVMSMNFHETTVDIAVDLTANFTLTGISTDRNGADAAGANIKCDVVAYFCDEGSAEVAPRVLVQGDYLQFCVEVVPEDYGTLWVRDVMNTDLDQDNNGNDIFQEPGDNHDDLITDYISNPLTLKNCYGGICNVKTQLASKYFATPFPNPLEIFGTVVCALGSPPEGTRSGMDIPLSDAEKLAAEQALRDSEGNNDGTSTSDGSDAGENPSGGTAQTLGGSDLSGPGPSPSPPEPEVEQSVEVSFLDGFPCDDSFFTLNGSPNLEYPKRMALEDGSDKCFLRLTPDEATPRASSAFTNFTFTQANTNKVFSMNIGYRIYGPNAGSGDGMAFVMHQDDRGLNALGMSGGNMGVYGNTLEEKVHPALVIEWDTYSNSWLLDEGINRIHIIHVDSSGKMTELAESGILSIKTDGTGLGGRMWVDHCDDGNLRVYINNIGDEKPLMPQVVVPVDLNTFFTGNDVVVGYTGATYGAADFHDILDWSMTQATEKCSAIPDPSPDTSVAALSYSVIDNPDGFPCDSMPFTINRGLNPVDMIFPSYLPYNSSLTDNRCFLRMTPDSQTPRASSAFLNYVFDEANTMKTFTMSIGFRIYGAQAGSGDGMTFVMHQDERGVNAVGGSGGAIGVYGTSNGITPALVIEWDTNSNPEFLDAGENRIHIMYVDVDGSLNELAETEPLQIRTSDDGSTNGRMWVDYCEDEVIRVYVNTFGDEKPAQPKVVVPFSLNGVFDGNKVVVGYTAGTSGEADNQDILDWSMKQDTGGICSASTETSSRSSTLQRLTEITQGNGFPCDGTFFTKNGNPDLQYPMSLPREDRSGNCLLRLTPDTATPRASSAFTDFSFNDNNTNKVFSMSIGYRIFGPNAGSGDGMAFVMHQDDRGVHALGASGGNMGVYGSTVEEMITPALVIEWDTHQNTWRLDDGINRIHIIYVDATGKMTELAESGLLPIKTSETGVGGRMWVDHCDDGNLRVYINNIGDEKPLMPQVVVPVDLNTIFTGNDVVVGYTGATYGAADFHDILDWSMTQATESCPAIPDPSQDISAAALSYSVIDSPDGFPCDSMPFTINRGTNPVDMIFPSYLPYGNSTADNRCFLRMTPDSEAPRASSAFLNYVFDETNTKKSFAMSIGYRIYGPEAGSADGMTFVMHQDARGVHAVGEPGGAIGVYGTAYNRLGATSGIAPALVIEWDTHPNPEYLDESENRIHIIFVDKDGNMNELAETEPLQIRTNDDGSTNGRMWVDYCEDEILRVYINTNGDEKPAQADAIMPFSISDVFEGNEVVVGYTAGTWAQADNQDILDWSLKQETDSICLVSTS